MTFNQYNVTTITQPYTASNEEYIISDGSTVTLPEPSENAIVAVASRDGIRVPVEPNATELVEFDSVARVGTTGATYFVSDGTNWYLESGRENVFGEIPDGSISQFRIDEGSGTTLNNQIDSQPNALINGADWFSDPNLVGGFGLDFDGESDVVELDSVHDFVEVDAQFTVCVTLEWQDLSDDQTFYHAVPDSGDTFFAFGMSEGTDGQIAANIDNTDRVGFSDGVVQDEKLRIGVGFDDKNTNIDTLALNGEVKSQTSSDLRASAARSGERLGAFDDGDFHSNVKVDNMVWFEGLFNEEDYQNDFERQPWS